MRSTRRGRPMTKAPKQAFASVYKEAVRHIGGTPGALTGNLYETREHETDVAYTRSDIADRRKRQLDEAYRALVDIRDAGRTAEGQSTASQRAQAALDAISAMSAPSHDQVHGSAAIAECGGSDDA